MALVIGLSCVILLLVFWTVIVTYGLIKFCTQETMPDKIDPDDILSGKHSE